MLWYPNNRGDVRSDTDSSMFYGTHMDWMQCACDILKYRVFSLICCFKITFTLGVNVVCRAFLGMDCRKPAPACATVLSCVTPVCLCRARRCKGLLGLCPGNKKRYADYSVLSSYWMNALFSAFGWMIALFPSSSWMIRTKGTVPDRIFSIRVLSS